MTMLRNHIHSMIKAKTHLARELRKRQTPGERILWHRLESHKCHGLKFRRQVPVGPYIVDFLCFERKVIIEVDGDSHYEEGAQERDRKREQYLRRQGFTIFRCGEAQAVENVDTVLERLAEFLGLSME